MPRGKNRRKLDFKPIFRSFIPEEGEAEGGVTLLHEEISAIYLMDVLGLYQEDAAAQMEVSRPTFARILKSARGKIAGALVSGYRIVIEDEREDTLVALCSDSRDEAGESRPSGEYLHIYHFNGNTVEPVEVMENPAYDSGQKPAIVLPQILLEKKVNLFVASYIGEGLKHSLLAKGIRPVVRTGDISMEILARLI